MEDDKKPALMKQANVGTGSAPLRPDHFGALGAPPEVAGEIPNLVSQPLSFVDAEEQLSKLRTLLFEGTASRSKTAKGEGEEEEKGPRAVVVDAGELDRIEQLCAALAPLERWAKEEAAHYRDEGSVLAEVGAPSVVVSCLLTRRPRLITSALAAAAPMLMHPQSCSELLRAAACAARAAARAEDGRVEEATEPGEAPLPQLLAELIARARGVEELCVAGIETAAVLADAAQSYTFCARVTTADSFISGALVSEVLGALELHQANSDILAAVTHFFASVVALPRENAEADAENERAQPPASLLFCHVGSVLSMMLEAARGREGNTTIRRNVLQFLRVCAAQPQNRQRLLAAGGYAFAIQCLSSHGGSGGRKELAGHARVSEWETFVAAAETVAYFPALLDAFQRRRYAQVVRNLLTCWGESRRVRLTLAMLHALLSAVTVDLQTAHADPTRQRPAGPFAAYALYPQPPSKKQNRRHVDAAQLTNTVTVKESEWIVSLCDPYDTIRVLHASLVPQLLSNMITHCQQQLNRDSSASSRGGFDTSELDEEERAAATALVALSDECLSMLMMLPPMPV